MTENGETHLEAEMPSMGSLDEALFVWGVMEGLGGEELEVVM